jgi:hypothetical protein
VTKSQGQASVLLFAAIKIVYSPVRRAAGIRNPAARRERTNKHKQPDRPRIDIVGDRIGACEESPTSHEAPVSSRRMLRPVNLGASPINARFGIPPAIRRRIPVSGPCRIPRLATNRRHARALIEVRIRLEVRIRRPPRTAGNRW